MNILYKPDFPSLPKRQIDEKYIGYNYIYIDNPNIVYSYDQMYSQTYIREYIFKEFELQNFIPLTDVNDSYMRRLYKERKQNVIDIINFFNDNQNITKIIKIKLDTHQTSVSGIQYIELLSVKNQDGSESLKLIIEFSKNVNINSQIDLYNKLKLKIDTVYYDIERNLIIISNFNMYYLFILSVNIKYSGELIYYLFYEMNDKKKITKLELFKKIFEIHEDEAYKYILYTIYYEYNLEIKDDESIVFNNAKYYVDRDSSDGIQILLDIYNLNEVKYYNLIHRIINILIEIDIIDKSKYKKELYYILSQIILSQYEMNDEVMKITLNYLFIAKGYGNADILFKRLYIQFIDLGFGSFLDFDIEPNFETIYQLGKLLKNCNK